MSVRKFRLLVISALPFAAIAANAQTIVSKIEYTTAALFWDVASVDARLGPDFEALNGAIVADTRPTLFMPPSTPWAAGYTRVNPYQIGGPPGPNGNYWSDSGQVAYVPNVATDPGLDRIQTFAYYNSVFAIAPKLDYASGSPHPEPYTKLANYEQLLGGPPMQPVAMIRNYNLTDNEGLVVYKDGLFGCEGTQTSRPAGTTIPGFVFPVNKIPMAIAITSENEFALVAVWDIDTQQGQLAVVALEGKNITAHTMPYMGFPNEGSWSDFKLLGYVDLPITMPNSVSAASNGYWDGPSQTNGEDLGQINLSSAGYRADLYNGAWDQLIATGGYAIVGSTQENTAVIVNLTPLIAYMRTSYLSSAASFAAATGNRGDGPTQFPQTFASMPSITPTVVWQESISQPTAVLAGMHTGRWTTDHYKAYVATQSGTVQIIDTSSIMARFSWEPKEPSISAIGTFQVGRNPVSMCFARHTDTDLPLIPNNSQGVQIAADPLNNTMYFACRGDREVQAAVTWLGNGAVYRTIQDTRMGDPVAVSVADRAYVVSVADFHGQEVLSFRIGALADVGNGKTYGAGPTGTSPYELAGQLFEPGSPFMLNSTNVN
jgi:hypothetical protein